MKTQKKKIKWIELLDIAVTLFCIYVFLYYSYLIITQPSTFTSLNAVSYTLSISALAIQFANWCTKKEANNERKANRK